MKVNMNQYHFRSDLAANILLEFVKKEPTNVWENENSVKGAGILAVALADSLMASLNGPLPAEPISTHRHACANCGLSHSYEMCPHRR